ncbi:hypothetical protein K9N68_38675 (plasmid) [Kovacikia minuta CCNUW1]|uniref:hypothetical protein n=1 Tax=Kovacikia minuta TaxID=2931930 RepID=UPI001CCD9EE7|nr:hypothetical protein [Kovacikia minuta]UBF30107.1 hypothetical protein K9N68_38675 [Kovacikia minuta CCNUW1]
MNFPFSHRYSLLGTLLCFGVCVLAIRQDRILQAQEPQALRKPENCYKVDVWKISKLEWNRPLKLNLSEINLLPSTGFNAVDYSKIPGPKTYSARPGLSLSASPGGLAGTLEDGAGRTQPTAVLLNETPRAIPLPVEPYSLAARSDGGAWVLFGEKLVRYDAEGNLKQSIRNPGGTRLVGVSGDAVWILSLDYAWFINAEGVIKGSWRWKGFLDSAGVGTSLCKLEGSIRQRIKCLESSGKENIVTLKWLQNKPSGSLLALTSDMLFTGDSYSLNRYRKNGESDRIVLQNVGLTTQEDAFVSILANEDWADVCSANRRFYSVPTKYTNPSFEFPPIPQLTVVAVEGERTLTYGYDRAIWYKNGHAEKSFVVDERRYRNDVFPHIWMINGSDSISVKSSDGTMVLASSGPSGIALIGLRWKP